MRTVSFLFVFLFLVIGCKDSAITKPDNLIDENVMVDIVYDLSLLEGVKTYNMTHYQGIKPNEFIYKKYKIDSLQFAKSTQFYASNIDKYKKIYEEVGKRIEINKAHIDSLISKQNPNLALPKKEIQKEQMVK